MGKGAARKILQATATAAVCALAACGGGGGGGGEVSPTPQACAPTNPFQGDAVRPTTSGSLDIEKAWVRKMIDDQYLWYDLVPNIDAARAEYSDTQSVYPSLDNFFVDLTNIVQDRFSFTYPTRLWEEETNAGASGGYGIEWKFSGAGTSRRIRIAYIEPGSPAAASGLLRGDELVSVDGIAANVASTSAAFDQLLDALFPNEGGPPHNFALTRSGASLFLTLVPQRVVRQPVLMHQSLSVNGRTVGYIVFNEHSRPAEHQLANAVAALRTAGVQDLILDLRYNSGGFLYIASQLAYMIAGPQRTGTQLFEQLQFNAKRSAETNSPDSRIGFISQGCLVENCTTDQPLPTLDLGRVFVITTESSCSASESIINGLQGVGVEVVRIGGTTCGKPYGFYGYDNCGISYFPMEFKGVNAVGFGDYATGFTPTCSATDDLSRALGQPDEGMLAAATYRLANGVCGAGFGAARESAQAPGAAADAGRLMRHPVRQSKFMLPRR